MKLPQGAEFSGEIPDAAEELLDELSSAEGVRLLHNIELAMQEGWPEAAPEDILESLAFVLGRSINGVTTKKNRAQVMAETFKRIRYWSDRIGDGSHD